MYFCASIRLPPIVTVSVPACSTLTSWSRPSRCPKDQRTLDRIDVPGMAGDRVERHALAFLDAVDHHVVAIDSGRGHIAIAAVIGFGFVVDQAVAAPDFAIACLTLIGGDEQDLDLDVDLGLDHQILAFAGKVQDMGADVAIGLVIDDEGGRALRRLAGQRCAARDDRQRPRQPSQRSGAPPALGRVALKRRRPRRP